MVAGAVIAIGSLMPWATYDFLFSLYSQDGLSLVYGVVTVLSGIGLVASALAAIGGYRRRSRLYAPAMAVSLLTIVTILVARFEIPLREDRPATIQTTFYGFGLWPVIIEAAAVIALIGSLRIRVVSYDGDEPPE